MWLFKTLNSSTRSIKEAVSYTIMPLLSNTSGCRGNNLWILISLYSTLFMCHPSARGHKFSILHKWKNSENSNKYLSKKLWKSQNSFFTTHHRNYLKCTKDPMISTEMTKKAWLSHRIWIRLLMSNAFAEEHTTISDQDVAIVCAILTTLKKCYIFVELFILHS